MLGAVAAALLIPSQAHAELRWSQPERIPGGTWTGVQIDSRGDLLAVSSTDDGAVYYSWRPPRGRWSEQRTLIAPNGSGFPVFYGVTLTPRGDAIAAIPQGDRIAIKTARPGSPFADDGSLEMGAGRVLPDGIRLASDDAGDIAAAWVDAERPVNAEDLHVNVAVRPVGKPFGAPQLVARGTNLGRVDLQMNAAGAAVATWMGVNGGLPFASYRPPAGSFGPAERMPLREDVRTPALNAAGDVLAEGNAMRFLPGDPSPAIDRSFSVRSALGGWSAPTPLSGDIGVESVFAEPSGNFSFVVAKERIGVMTRLAGGDLTDPTWISSPGTGFPNTATNGRGEVLSAWTLHPNGEGGPSTVMFAERPASGAFGPERTISPPSAFGEGVALNDAGQAAIIWSHAVDADTYETQVAVKEDPDLPPLPFPPAVDIGTPAVPELSPNGTLKLPVRCSQRCSVRAQGLLFARHRHAKRSRTTGVRRLRAHRRGHLVLHFGRSARRARGSVSAIVTATGRSRQPITFTRRIRLR